MFNRVCITLLLFLVTSPCLQAAGERSVPSVVEANHGNGADVDFLDDMVIPDEMVNQMQHERPSLYKRMATAYAAAKVVVAQHVAEHKTAYTVAAIAAAVGIIYWLSQK